MGMGYLINIPGILMTQSQTMKFHLKKFLDNILFGILKLV